MTNFPQLPQVGSPLSQLGQSFIEGQNALQKIKLSKQQIETAKLQQELVTIQKQAAQNKLIHEQQRAQRSQQLRQTYANTPREEIENGKIVETLLKEGFHEEALEIQNRIQKEKDIETRTMRTMYSNLLQDFASKGDQNSFDSIVKSLPSMFGEDSAMSEFANKIKDLKLEGGRVSTFQIEELGEDNKYGLNPGKYKLKMSAPSSDLSKWGIESLVPLNAEGDDESDFTPSNVISMFNRQMEIHFDTDKAKEATFKTLKELNPNTKWTTERINKQTNTNKNEFEEYKTAGEARKAAKKKNIPWFGNEESAAKAFASGKIKPGDRIIIGNREGEVED